ncbi:MAG: redoxin domain-containing protein [Candidatus Omnitrophota bacterium]|nr:redoxin domain-containing protein [Candidatus Omnitrophota bacterium]
MKILRTLGVMTLTIWFSIFSVDESAHIFMAAASAAEAESAEFIPITKAPIFPKKGKWLNAKRLGKDVFKGKLTLLYFWDYTSVNCIRELGDLKRWFDRYHAYGLEVILIHAPEFEFAGNKKHLKRALERMNITFPVFLDNGFEMWEEYAIRSWPTKNLVNREGLIVHTQVGEGKNLEFEKLIRKELEVFRPQAVLPGGVLETESDDFSAWDCGEMSLETYVGYKRASWWGIEVINKPNLLPDETSVFRDRGERMDRGFFLEGTWTNHEDYFEHARTIDDYADYLGFMYRGTEMYAVISMMQKSKETRIYVSRDDEPVPALRRGVDLLVDESGSTYLSLEEPRLYYIIANEDESTHEIKFAVKAKGVAFYVFSFSNRCLSDFDHL